MAYRLINGVTELADSEKGGRRAGTRGISRIYQVQSNSPGDTEYGARDFVAEHDQFPSTVDNKPLADVVAEEIPDKPGWGQQCGFYEVTATWSVSTVGGGTGNTPVQPDTGESEFGFSFRLPGGRIMRSRNTERPAAFDTQDSPAGGTLEIDNFGKIRHPGLVGVKRTSKGALQHVGVDLPNPPINLGPFTVYVAASAVTGTYLKAIAEAISEGAVNSTTTTFAGMSFDPGELLMVEVSGQRRGVEDYAISYGIYYLPNRTTFDVGPWTCNFAKEGHQLVSAEESEQALGDVAKPGLRTEYIYVDDIWQKVDYSVFGTFFSTTA